MGSVRPTGAAIDLKDAAAGDCAPSLGGGVALITPFSADRIKSAGDADEEDDEAGVAAGKAAGNLAGHALA
jgi:hypothetical protein